MDNPMSNSKIKLLYILLLKVFSVIFVATKTVFINRKYIIMVVFITIFFWIILNYLEQLIFFLSLFCILLSNPVRCFTWIHCQQYHISTFGIGIEFKCIY